MILMKVLGPSVGQLHMSSLWHLEHLLKNYRNMFIFNAENEITKRAFGLLGDLTSRLDLLCVLYSTVLLQVPAH